MTTSPASVPAGQTDVDDWFDLDKYKQAAEVAYGFSKKKMEEADEVVRIARERVQERGHLYEFKANQG